MQKRALTTTHVGTSARTLVPMYASPPHIIYDRNDVGTHMHEHAMCVNTYTRNHVHTTTRALVCTNARTQLKNGINDRYSLPCNYAGTPVGTKPRTQVCSYVRATCLRERKCMPAFVRATHATMHGTKFLHLHIPTCVSI